MDRPTDDAEFNSAFEVKGALRGRLTGSATAGLLALSRAGDIRVEHDAITSGQHRPARASMTRTAMTTTRLYGAHAMALAFDMRLRTRDDVATWVGALVLELDVLPDALLELTTLRRKDDDEIIRLLEELGPRVAPQETARLVVALLDDALAEERVTCARAFSYLWNLVMRDELPRNDTVAIYQIGDTYDWGRAEEADAAVRVFLHERRSPGAALGGVTPATR